MCEVLLDSKQPTQAYTFNIVCFYEPFPIRTECTPRKDRTRFRRSRSQTRPSAFPALHQPRNPITATLPALAITLEALLGRISCYWDTLGTGTHTRTSHTPHMHAAAIV